MKRKFKGLSCVIASLLLSAGLGGTNTFADENSEFGQDYAIVNESEYQEYLSTLSDEQLQEISLKESMMQEIMAQGNTFSTYATKISLPGTFTMYQQETDTYCGPACVKSALMYINDSSPSQTSINRSIKQDFSAIPKYINKRQSRSPYILLTSPTQTNITSTITVDIRHEIPTFLRLSGTSTPSWYYSTNGHCVLSNAVYSDYSKIQIADPLGDRVSGCPYFYEKNASTVSSYTTHLIY